MQLRRFNIRDWLTKQQKQRAGAWMLDPLIDYLPIPTWAEDFSPVKAFINNLKAAGVDNYRAYFESHPEDVRSCAGMVKILKINQAGLNALDIKNPREIPQRITDHFVDETWPAFCEELIALAEGQFTYRREVMARNLVNTRGRNVVELYLYIAPEDRETLRQVLVTFVDLTERNHVEMELRQSEERYRTLFEGSPMGISISRGGVQLFANHAYARMFGFTEPSELIGKPITELVVPQDRQAILDRSLKRDQGFPIETHYEVTGLRRDGRTFPIQLDVTQVPLEDGLASMAFIQDITTRKEAEQALKESESNLNALIEKRGESIWSIDTQYRYVILNDFYIQNFERAYHIPITRGTNVLKSLPPELRAFWKEKFDIALQGENIIFQISEMIEGQKCFFEVNLHPIKTRDQITGVSAIAVDITERKRAEEDEHQQRILAESLRDTAAALNSNLDFDQILDSILDNARRVLPHNAIDIMLIDPQGIARIIRSRGYAEQGCESLIPTISFRVADTPNLVKMATTSQPIIIPDVKSDPSWTPTEGLTWVRSYAGMPVRQKDKVIGFINLSSTTPDFYHPDQIDRLRAFVDQVAIAFTNARLVDELQKANERLQAQLSEIQVLQNELREQAIRDPLTGLFNRRYLKEILDREIVRTNREGMQLSIIVMDVDYFKQVNDTAGHEAGDLALKAISRLLEKSIRLDDIACRYGGEEFVIVMPGAPLIVASDRAERIRCSCEQMAVTYEDQEVRATLSIGVAAYPTHGASGEEVLIRADRALYIAKQSGRNRVVIYQETMRTPFSIAKLSGKG